MRKFPSFEDYVAALTDHRNIYDPRIREKLQGIDFSREEAWWEEDTDMPKASTGAYGHVFKFGENCRQTFAVKCFKEESDERTERYEVITDYIKNWRRNKAPCLIEYLYTKQALRVVPPDDLYPLMIMEWCDGTLLNEYVRNNCSDAEKLRMLAEEWRKAIISLEEVGIAHGDLQHGNIFVLKNPLGTLKLVDYDGMYVNHGSFQGKRAVEIGLPNYQHPKRKYEFNKYIDIVPALGIYISLLAFQLVAQSTDKNLRKDIEEIGPGDDWLLFKKDDLDSPKTSQTFKVLKKIGDRDLQDLLSKFEGLLKKNFSDITVSFSELVTPVAVNVTAPTSIFWREAGKPINCDFVVTNKGNNADSFKLAAASKNNWRTTTVANTGNINPGSSKTITVQVTIPPGTGESAIDKLTLKAISVLDSKVSGEWAVDIVKRRAGVNVTTKARTVGGEVGKPVSCNFVVDNKGNSVDSFNLIATSEKKWFVKIDGGNNTGNINPESSKTITVQVTIPPGIDESVTDELRLKATSVFNGNISRDALVRIVIIKVDVKVTASVPTFTGNPGETVNCNFVVDNKGNIADSFNLVATSEKKWFVKIDGGNNIGSINAGSSRMITVQITIPPETEESETDELTLKATSVFNSKISRSTKVCIKPPWRVTIKFILQGIIPWSSKPLTLTEGDKPVLLGSKPYTHKEQITGPSPNVAFGVHYEKRIFGEIYMRRESIYFKTSEPEIVQLCKAKDKNFYRPSYRVEYLLKIGDKIKFGKKIYILAEVLD